MRLRDRLVKLPCKKDVLQGIWPLDLVNRSVVQGIYQKALQLIREDDTVKVLVEAPSHAAAK